jgi:hypothetical protein
LQKKPQLYRTLGGIFYELCDEIDELDWTFALQLLIEILEDALQNVNQKIKKLIESQLRKWIVVLPNYIKAYLPKLSCESWVNKLFFIILQSWVQVLKNTKLIMIKYSHAEFEWNYGEAIFDNKELALPQP